MKKAVYLDAELRRAMRRKHDEPMICILAGQPLVEPVGLSAGHMRGLKMGGVILAMVSLGILAFLVLRL
jgi:hypothetical protein